MLGGKKAVMLLLASAGVALVSCINGTSSRNNTLTVSIEPLRYIVEGIVGDDFEISVLVLPGANPETYEPTSRQLAAAEDALLIFSTGLIDFERIMQERLPASERFVDLSSGIELIEAEAGVAEPRSASSLRRRSHTHGGERNGVDPHIWVSPQALAQMARTAYERIHELYPDSTSYTANYTRFEERIATLDRLVTECVTASSVRSFVIFHPGLTYYARDYGLRQIALEHDGKEPSARQLAETVALAQAEGISKVLYQSEFPRHTVEIMALEIGAEPVEIDILGYDIVDNILKITELITEAVPEATTLKDVSPKTPARQ